MTLSLSEVLALVQREFDMPIRWSENGNIVPEIYSQDCEIAAVYSERDDDKCPRKAEAIIAAVNYLRSHGEAIAELIEADKEYDAALGLVRQTEATYGKRSAAAGRARAALDLANERRAAALSNIEGGQQS